jgi:hypothetical protein
VTHSRALIVATLLVGLIMDDGCARTQYKTTSDPTADRAEILRLYRAIGRAHLEHDSAGFVIADADTVLLVANGTVQTRSRDDALRRVGEYLRGRTITEVTELEPPRISVSSDGHFASLIGDVRVRGNQRLANDRAEPFAFTAAWLDLWEKDASGWHIVAHANTEAAVP